MFKFFNKRPGRAAATLRKRRLARLRFIAALSFVFSLCGASLLFLAFLLFPALIISTGFVAPFPLKVITAVILAAPAVFLIIKIPFAGRAFRDSIILPPYGASDIKAVLELEKGRYYPRPEDEDAPPDFLRDRYTERVLSAISREGGALKYFLRSARGLAAAVTALALISGLGYYRFAFLSDIAAALASGLPAELISIGPVMTFEKLEASVLPPSYIDSSSAAKIDLNKHDKIEAMNGSRIIISGVSAGALSGRLFFSSEGGVEYFPVQVEGEGKFEVSFLSPRDGAFAIEITGKAGGRGKTGKSRIYRIVTAPDRPPSIKIHSPGRRHSVVFGNSFGISFTAADDYGILEINLHHRAAGSGSPYNVDLIARFPRESKTEYTSTHMWNPVISEGEKVYHLRYGPETKGIEYFLEVKDINLFSEQGVARSKDMYLSFNDMFTDLKRGVSIIQELIKKGEKLQKDTQDSGMRSDYLKALNSAIDRFTGELKDMLPQSSLLSETRRMAALLSRGDNPDINGPLESYISFLRNYLLIMSMVMEAERADVGSGEMLKTADEFTGGDPEDYLKKMAGITEFLGQDFKKELAEINSLLKKGKQAEAQKKISELFEKVKKKMTEKLKKSEGRVREMAKEAKEKLEKLKKDAEAALEKQTESINDAPVKTFEERSDTQKTINESLKGISGDTEELNSRYPIIMAPLRSHAMMAENNGVSSLRFLEQKKAAESLAAQHRTADSLRRLIEALSREQKEMENMMSGNMDRLRSSSGLQNRFVYIPKKAVYTVPVDYKEKIIERSKERGRSSSEKNAFWRDMLE